MKGQGIRIIVSEPFEWKYGNLFGTVVKQTGNKLLVRLSEFIRGNSFSSDLMELEPRYEGDSFKPLGQHYSVTVGGALIHPQTNEADYVLIGTVTLD